MLTHVEIKNYRSCRHVVLDDLGPMTVLVGRNAAGKSNILRAIRWLVAKATTEQDDDLLEARSMSCDAALEEADYRYSLRVGLVSESRGRLRTTGVFESLQQRAAGSHEICVFEREGDEVQIPRERGRKTVAIGRHAGCMPALLSLLPASSLTLKAVRPFFEFLQGIRYYDWGPDAQRPDSGLISQAEYDRWLARQPGDPGSSALMRLVHMAMTSEEQFAEVRSILGPDGLGLLDRINHRRVHVVERRAAGGDRGQLHDVAFIPALRLRSGIPGLSFGDLAAGTQRITRIVTSLVHDQSSVMLLEHPEDGIHRGLLRKLIDLLQGYSDEHQLLIASHSSIVFNSLDPKAIRLVTMGKDGTGVRSLTEKELRAAKTFIEEEGTMSDFIRSVEEV